MKLEATKIFDFMHSNYREYKDRVDKIIFVLEGSSGSSKTFSVNQFLYVYAQENARKKIVAGRAKMTWTINSIWNDFKDASEAYGLGYQFNLSRYEAKTPSDCRFRFFGADDPQKLHGPRQDVSWFNEAMELSQKSFNQLNMRTNELFILDYNPSAEKHWIFDTLLKGMKPHGDGLMKLSETVDGKGKKITEAVFYLHSTFKDNPYLPAGQRKVILGYEPTPENIANGTADQFHWDVYGLGVRAVAKGAIFPYWTVGKLPPDLEGTAPLGCWLDFGFTNDPCAMGRMWHKDGTLYVKEFCYETDLTNVPNPDHPQQRSIVDVLRAERITDELIVADSAEKKSIREIRMHDFQVIPIDKGKIVAEITRLRKYKVVIVDSLNIEEEKRMYRWVENAVDGSLTNKPIDKHNHHMDGIRYLTKFLELKGLI